MRIGRIAALSLLLASGCASYREQLEAYNVEGVQYGTTAGAFRGRWWNYYERGRSYLAGGFYEQALADFDAARAGRAADQVWARTYGMHFALEYFPNRETGIAHYYRGEHDAAIEWLDRSLTERATARAEYFLGLARTRQIEAQGGDAVPPVIALTAEPGAPGTLTARISGQVTDDRYVREVVVGGHAAGPELSSPSVTIDLLVPLRSGENTIPVRAADLLGNIAETELKIVADGDGPAISFDGPVVAPGTVRGMAYDASGIASITIGGYAAALYPQADGLVRFEVHGVAPEPGAPLAYSALDTHGNATNAVLPLDAIAIEAGARGLALAHARTWAWRGRTLHAEPLADGRILLMAQADAAPASIAFVNVAEGDQFYTDEIVVALDVRAAAPVQQLLLNGRPVPLVPGRAGAAVSQRIPIELGPVELLAEAVDASGGRIEARRNIVREAAAIDEPANKLGVSFLARPDAALAAGAGLDPGTLLGVLESTDPIQRRFRYVGRDLMPQILAEQELSQYLSAAKSRLQPGQLIPVEVLFEVDMRRDAESIELVVRAVGTETGRLFFNFLDVAGSIDDWQALAEKAATRIVQEFPRASAPIAFWDNPNAEIDLGERDRLRDAMKCVVYERTPRGEPRPGEPVQYRTKVVCQGLLTGVGPDFSTVRLFPDADGGPIDFDIRTGDDAHWVVLK